MNKLSNQLDNLQGYCLIKKLKSSEFNSTIHVITYKELKSFSKRNLVCKVVAIASYDFYNFKHSFASYLEIIILPNNQSVAIDTIKFNDKENVVVLDYNWWTGNIEATLKDKEVYFSVYLLYFEVY